MASIEVSNCLDGFRPGPAFQLVLTGVCTISSAGCPQARIQSASLPAGPGLLLSGQTGAGMLVPKSAAALTRMTGAKMSGVWSNVLGRCDGQWQVTKVHGAVPSGCWAARLVSQGEPWLRWTPSATVGAVTAAIPGICRQDWDWSSPGTTCRNNTLLYILYTV